MDSHFTRWQQRERSWLREEGGLAWAPPSADCGRVRAFPFFRQSRVVELMGRNLLSKVNPEKVIRLNVNFKIAEK